MDEKIKCPRGGRIFIIFFVYKSIASDFDWSKLYISYIGRQDEVPQIKKQNSENSA